MASAEELLDQAERLLELAAPDAKVRPSTVVAVAHAAQALIALARARAELDVSTADPADIDPRSRLARWGG